MLVKLKMTKRIREVIIVEGRYDKNAVSQVIEGTIIETAGFGVFSDAEKLALLRRLAEKRGLVILTDSDSAGFFIRGRLRGMLGDLNIKHAYIPDIAGRERRKSAHSKEGKLGVEGMAPAVILTALERAGVTFEDDGEPGAREHGITKADLYSAGFSGGKGSAYRRRELLERLDLPSRLSANSLLDVLNALFSREDLLDLLQSQ